MTTRIGILEVGDRPENLQQKYPSYSEMIVDWLSPMGGEASIYPLLQGAALPEPTDAELWVITGSKYGVYENHPWLPPLMDFIVKARQAQIKMLGICFGHQAIAQALGGQVTRSNKGWGVGLFHYQTHWPESLVSAPRTISINAYHQDQVITPPPQAQSVASSDFCPYAGLWYPGFAITFQGHPEFNQEYEGDLIKLRHKSGLLPDDISLPALESLSGQNNRAALAQWLAEHWQRI